MEMLEFVSLLALSPQFRKEFEKQKKLSKAALQSWLNQKGYSLTDDQVDNLWGLKATWDEDALAKADEDILHQTGLDPQW